MDRLVLMPVHGYKNGTNQLSQHIFEASKWCMAVRYKILCVFPLDNPFTHLYRYGNGTSQLSQHFSQISHVCHRCLYIQTTLSIFSLIGLPFMHGHRYCDTTDHVMQHMFELVVYCILQAPVHLTLLER